MAKPTKRRVAGGRVTPKGTRPETDRYSPPMAAAVMPSPVWVPILMFGLLGLGALSILLNYLGVPPGSPDNWYLLVGLGLILLGIITATQYR